MKTLKHLFTTLLLLCATVATAHDFKVGSIYYRVTNPIDKTVEVTFRGSNPSEYSKEYSGAVTIPATVTYSGTTYSVTGIGYEAFGSCSTLTNVTIPGSVTYILYEAFAYCTGLKSIVIPSSVTLIYTGNKGLFYGCSNLESIVVESGNTRYDSRENCNAIIETASNTLLTGCKNTIIPEGITSIKDMAFSGCKGLASIVIPNSVTSIGDYAFSECQNLSDITIPESVTRIGDGAFYDTEWYNSQPDGVVYLGKVLYKYKGVVPSNTTIEVKDGTVSISSNAFYSQSQLTKIVVPKSVYIIGAGAFDGTGVVYKNGTTYIGNVLYKHSGTDSTFELKPGTTGIADEAFINCAYLTSIYYYNAYFYCSDRFPASVTNIGEAAFSGCTKLRKIIIPYNITDIGNFTFSGCTSLEEVKMHSAINSIGAEAFYGCSELSSITIPENVTKIERDAFSYCTNLTSITCNIPANKLFPISFDYVFYQLNRSKCTLYVPKGAKTTYMATEGWKEFAKIVEVEAEPITGQCGKNLTWDLQGVTLTITGTGAMYDFENYSQTPWRDYSDDIEKVVIDDGVTSIGDYAFDNFENLTNVVIPNSVTSIGNHAFTQCISLSEVVIPTSVREIEKHAFSYSGLKSVSIPNNVTIINPLAFGYCRYLSNVTMGSRVTSIGQSAFRYCVELTEISLPNSVTTIGVDAFAESGIEYIKLPTALTQIGNGAFWMSAIKSINIPDNVKVIGDRAFYDCENLRCVIVGKNVSTIGNEAFSSARIFNRSKLKISGSVDVPNSFFENDFLFNKNDDNTYSLIAYAGSDTKIILPNKCKTYYDYNIGSYVFGDDITSVTIPNGVTSIGGAFNGCTSLKEVHISDIAAWCRIDFASSDANPLYYAKNLYLNGELVTELVIPEGVKEIKKYAFYYCTGLTSIELPNSVTSIGDYAFRGCSNLETVINFSNLTLTKGSSDYGYVAYYAEEVLNAPNGSVEGDFVFGVFDGVNTLMKYKSAECASVNFEDWTSTNTSNGSSSSKTYTFVAKEDNALTFDWMVSSESGYDIFSVTINGNQVLSESGEKSGHYEYVFPVDGEYTLVARYKKDNSSRAGSDCGKIYNIQFDDGSAVDVVLPDDYKGEEYVIGAEVFKNCNIGNITIPAAVAGIGEGAFFGCSRLKSIVSYIAAETLFVPEADAFAGVDKTTCILYVPVGAKEIYATTDGWREFVNIVEIEPAGIDELKAENGKVKTVYDLQGRVVENPTNGIYIINGKKVLVK